MGYRKEINELRAVAVTDLSLPLSEANRRNTGYCLVKASYLNTSLDVCDFRIEEMAQDRVDAYAFLSKVEQHYPVVWLKNFFVKTAHVFRNWVRLLSIGTLGIYQ